MLRHKGANRKDTLWIDFGRQRTWECSIVNIELHTWAHWCSSWRIFESLNKYQMDFRAIFNSTFDKWPLTKGQPRLDKQWIICSILGTSYHHPGSVNMGRADEEPAWVTDLLRTQAHVDIYLSVFWDYISKTITVLITLFQSALFSSMPHIITSRPI